MKGHNVLPFVHIRLMDLLHTHAHTCTHANACTHARMHAHTHMHTHTYMAANTFGLAGCLCTSPVGTPMDSRNI